MGLIFNKKTPGGVVNKKFVPGSELDAHDIRSLPRKLGLTSWGARHEFRTRLTRDQHDGSLTREEFRGGLKDLVARGYIKPRRATKIAHVAGLKGKQYTRFKSADEMELPSHQEAKAEAKELTTRRVRPPVAEEPIILKKMETSRKTSLPPKESPRLSLKPLPPLPTGPSGQPPAPAT